MNINNVNIIVVLAALSALAGCGTTDIAANSQGQPIMSAAEAKSMISIEVKAIEPALSEQELVAAAD